MRDPKRHQQLSDWGFTAVRLGKDGDGDIIVFFKMIFMWLHQEQCGPGLNQMWKEFSTRPMSRSCRFVHLDSNALQIQLQEIVESLGNHGIYTYLDMHQVYINT